MHKDMSQLNSERRAPQPPYIQDQIQGADSAQVPDTLSSDS